MTFKNVRVVNGAAAGWQLGFSATLDDCTAEGCATEGFSTNSLGGAGPLASHIRFNRCQAIGNGTDGFMNFGNVWLFDLHNCESRLNGGHAFNIGYGWMRIVESNYEHGQAGTFINGKTNQIFYDRDSTKRPRILGPWSKLDVAASLTNVALATLDPPGAAGAVNTVKMDRNGSVVGICILIRNNNDARTAGTLTVEALKNGAALGTPETVALNGATPLAADNSPINPGVNTYVSGDTIGVRVTTDGAWAPATADIDVWVAVVDD